MSGAGSHKSPKDYDRKDKKLDIKKELEEGEERSDIRDLMIPKIKDYLERKGPGSYISLEDLESDLYDYASHLDHDDLESSSDLRNFMHNPGEEASSAVTELLSGMYHSEFDDYITTESDDNSHEITLEDNQDFNEEFGVLGYSECDEDVFEAEYQGRTVKLNKPMQGDVKKFKVYVKDPKTKNVKKVNFGHGGSSVKGKSMRIRKSNPKARKSFRARHNCSNPGPKTKARYWSCRKW
jgi:hypothetical protein